MRANQHDNDKFIKFSITRSGQSALEYMMTYGWAILIIVIVAVILYSMGIFNPASSISSTITGFSATPVSNAICTANGILRIAVGDTTGHRILIKNISATSNGKTEVFTPSSTVDPNPIITSGNTYIFSVPNVCPAAGTRFSASVNINYTEPTTLFSTSQYTSTGTVTGIVSSSHLTTSVANFNGVNSYINASATKGINVFESNSSFTFSAWVYIVSSLNHYQDFVTSGFTCSVDKAFEVGTNINTANTNFYMAFCSDDISNQGNVFVPGTWYYIVAEWSNTTRLQELFLNGVLNESHASSGYLNTSSSSVCFGGGTSGCWGPGVSLDGMMTNIQIYRQALSSQQIKTLFNEGFSAAPLQSSSLIGWWPLNGTVKDYSGNGNNGVATNVVYTSNYPATGLS